MTCSVAERAVATASRKRAVSVGRLGHLGGGEGKPAYVLLQLVDDLGRAFRADRLRHHLRKPVDGTVYVVAQFRRVGSWTLQLGHRLPPIRCETAWRISVIGRWRAGLPEIVGQFHHARRGVPDGLSDSPVDFTRSTVARAQDPACAAAERFGRGGRYRRAHSDPP